MSEVNDYTILVDLKGEEITLGADNPSEAISKARKIIAEQYGDSVANDATYSLDKKVSQ